jgi:hypothetical protein
MLHTLYKRVIADYFRTIIRLCAFNPSDGIAGTYLDERLVNNTILKPRDGLLRWHFARYYVLSTSYHNRIDQGQYPLQNGWKAFDRLEKCCDQGAGDR